MSHEAITSWLEKAKNGENVPPQPAGVQIIRREESRNKGTIIMDMAEKIRPWLMKMFEGVRDENNMLVPPARVRGIALNLAQEIVNEEDKKQANG